MAAESRKAVVAAIIGNLAIAVVKFVAAAFTGSSAMISEGIHSLVDTGNGGLLYHGLRRGTKPADEQHPFGHGGEVYFWSLIVAVSIFGIGGGMSVYEGVTHMLDPAPLSDPTLNYVVLAAAMVFEGISLTIAWRAFRQSKGTRRTLAAIRQGKDPSLFTVLFEDAAALLGLLVAFAGVFLSHTLREPLFDGGASVVIGIILIGAALWLAAESKSLLVGEAADAEIVGAIREIAAAHPAVRELATVLTMHLGPEDVLVTMEAVFVAGATAEEIALAVQEIERRLAARHPQVSRVFIEARSLAASVSSALESVSSGGGG